MFTQVAKTDFMVQVTIFIFYKLVLADHLRWDIVIKSYIKNYSALICNFFD